MLARMTQLSRIQRQDKPSQPRAYPTLFRGIHVLTTGAVFASGCRAWARSGVESCAQISDADLAFRNGTER